LAPSGLHTRRNSEIEATSGGSPFFHSTAYRVS
jgi:hypothetical protein